jgi:hypothetical protein
VKVLVCGGRDYGTELITDKGGKSRRVPCLVEKNILWDYLGVMHRGVAFTHVIHGNASGADNLADTWAREHGVQRVIVPADWNTLGKSAGMIRNRRMLELQPDIVVAFPGGRGTEGMVRIANEGGVEVHRVATKDEYTFADHTLEPEEAKP